MPAGQGKDPGLAAVPALGWRPLKPPPAPQPRAADTPEEPGAGAGPPVRPWGSRSPQETVPTRPALPGETLTRGALSGPPGRPAAGPSCGAPRSIAARAGAACRPPGARAPSAEGSRALGAAPPAGPSSVVVGRRHSRAARRQDTAEPEAQSSRPACRQRPAGQGPHGRGAPTACAAPHAAPRPTGRGCTGRHHGLSARSPTCRSVSLPTTPWPGPDRRHSTSCLSRPPPGPPTMGSHKSALLWPSTLPQSRPCCRL